MSVRSDSDKKHRCSCPGGGNKTCTPIFGRSTPTDVTASSAAADVDFGGRKGSHFEIWQIVRFAPRGADLLQLPPVPGGLVERFLSGPDVATTTGGEAATNAGSSQTGGGPHYDWAR